MKARFAWAGVLLSIAPLLGQSYPAATTVFSNVFGGKSGTDAATGLAVDPSGNVAVIGTTTSPDFPVTHAYQPMVARPPLLAISPTGWGYPNLGPAVDVVAMASTTDGSIVYAASDSGIFRSADGGVTWVQQLPGIAGANTLAVDGADPNTLYTAIANNTINPLVGAFKSTDGGQNWVRITSLPLLPFLFVPTLQCPSQIAGTIYATDNGFYRSRDGGLTWTVIGPHNNNVFSFALAPSDPNVVYTVSSDGFVYRSANGGDTWTTPGGMFAAYPNANGNLYPFGLAVDPNDENTVWALELNGNLNKSADGGATFSIVLSDPAEQAALFLSIGPSGQNIIVSSRGQSGGGKNAIVSFDSGASWTRVITPFTVNGVLAGQNGFFIETDASTQGFLTKWSADGSRMIFSTFLDSGAGAVAEDAAGNTYVAGQTLLKFSPYGDLIFSQPLGGYSANAMVLDSAGDLYLAASPPAVGSSCGTAAAPIVMKFDAQGNLIFANIVPETCGLVFAMAVDASGAIYLSGLTFSASLATTATAIAPVAPENSFGESGFLAVLTLQADQVTYLSYAANSALGLALDPSGNVYVVGSATRPLPFTPVSTFAGSACTSATAQIGYLMKVSRSSTSPVWLAEIGGGCNQVTTPSQVAVDANGNVWVGGATSSGALPTVAPFEVQDTDQGFVAELSADGSTLLLSSYAPGHFALGPQQTLYLAGASLANPPKVDIQVGPASSYAIVDKINLSAQSAVIDSITSVLAPVEDIQAQLLGIAPGEMIRISGRGLGPVGTLVATFDSSGRVATVLGGVQVLINGVPAPLISVQASAIVCMTPFEVGGHSSATVQIVLNGVATPAITVGVKEVTFTPGVLSIANQNGSFNSPSNPARVGESVTLYVTGFGPTNPSVPDGSLYKSPLPLPVYAVSAVGNKVTYAGPAPSLVAGIWAVDVTLATAAANPLQLTLTSSYQVSFYTPQVTVQVWVSP
jgi:uncharacterized protein (TIGR03437 family)